MLDRVLAIDIGGTKLAAGVVDGSGGLHQRVSCPTPRQTAPEALFDSLADLVAPLLAPPGGPAGHVRAVGVGCGGPMAPGGETVSPLNIPAWREFPLRARLAGR